MHPKRLFGILYALGLVLLIVLAVRSIPQDPVGVFVGWVSELSWNSKTPDEKREAIGKEYYQEYEVTGVLDTAGLRKALAQVK